MRRHQNLTERHRPEPAVGPVGPVGPVRLVRLVRLVSLALLLAAGIARAASPAPACERRLLPGGLEAAVERVPGSRLLAVHVLVKNRAAGEPQGRAGIADLAHRVLLQAGDDPARQALLSRLDAIGADLKAVDDPAIPFDDYYTVEEFSYLRFQVLDRFRDEGLRLLAELLAKPVVTDATLAAARAAQAEVRARREKGPRAVAERAWWEAVFPGSWKSRPVYGTADSLEGLTVTEFKDWFGAHFRPGNLVLTVQTAAPPRVVLRQLASAFAAPRAAAGAVPAPRAPLPPPAAAGEDKVRSVTLASRQGYILAGDVFPVESADLPALEIAVALLSERVSFELREKRGLAYSLGAGLEGLDGGRLASLTVSMGTRPENVETARAGIREVLEAFGREALTDREVATAVNKARGRFLMRCLLSLNRAFYMGLDLYRGAPPCAYRGRPDGWKSVTPADVRRVRDRYIKPPAFRWILVHP
ncbi:MAG: insulinase family protein [Acidobacteria bacterium]|nr:insulinase family protein [Acidobacteriota bacterium]